MDRVLSDLYTEAEKSYIDRNYFAGLACLFILSEQALKDRMESRDGNFKSLIFKAKCDGIISEDEFLFLNKLREIRNSLFHESHYENAFVFNDFIYPVYEEDTKKILFEKLNDGVLKFISKA